jgi:hypothetical protein
MPIPKQHIEKTSTRAYEGHMQKYREDTGLITSEQPDCQAPYRVSNMGHKNHSTTA